MSYFYQQFPCKIYTKQVPENFVVPSMYFPAPLVFDSDDTNMTFMKTYSLPVKLFHQDEQQAYSEAERIAETVARKRNLIPLINQDGTPTGQFIRMNRIDVRVTDNVASLVVNWDSRYHYDREEQQPLEHFQFENGVK